jgi:hypothetical protein
MASLLPQGPVIITRYKGPTNHRGSRIVATHKRDSETTYRVTLSWDHALSEEENHRVAANACLESWQYLSLVIVACGHDANGYCWVCAYQAPGS